MEDFNSMSQSQIKERLDALTSIAASRRLRSDGMFSATMGGADTDFMTPSELEERHKLMLCLPTFAEERQAAQERIRIRIMERRNRRHIGLSTPT